MHFELSPEKTEEISKKFRLSRLYVIGAKEEELCVKVCVGLRKKAEPAAFDELKTELLSLLRPLDARIGEVSVLENPRDEVEYVLDEKVRDAIALHGGTVEIFEIDEEAGLVTLSMKDACSGCPHAMATLTMGMEFALRECLPWVKDVQSADDPVEPDFKFRID